MAIKKKKTSSFNDEVLLYSNYQENYEEELAEVKRQLEEVKKAQLERFKEYEAQYDEVKAKNYVVMAQAFLSLVGVEDYPTLKNALKQEFNKSALNRSKDFNVLCEGKTKNVMSLIELIKEDEAIMKQIAEYVRLVEEDNADEDKDAVQGEAD